MLPKGQVARREKAHRRTQPEYERGQRSEEQDRG